MADVPTIVYELALRALEQQERELSELRARTNTVIAAVIASFLGAAAIREHGGLSGWSVLALIVLALTGGLSLVVLWPRELSFAFDARKTYAELYRCSIEHPRPRCGSPTVPATATEQTSARSTALRSPSRPPC